MRLLILLHLLLANPCLADGMVFRRSAELAPMPAQCALLSWNEGVETLAIRTEIDSAAGDSAWVVPVPSVPQLLDVKPGVVESARASFAPRVAPDDWSFVGEAWVLLVVLVGLSHLVAAAGSRVWTRVAIVAGLAFGLFFFILPMAGRVRSVSLGAVAPVDVLERRVVGAHEVAVISSADPAALAAWLERFGLVLPPDAAAPIAAYCKEGWCFVAARLQDPGSAGLHTPAPVGMRFKSSAPVYPMRLTGVGNGGAASKPLTLELLVFGPSTAAVPGMAVESSSRVEVPVDSDWVPGLEPREAIRVSHAGVQALVQGSAWATRLRGTFTPGAMASDLGVTFGPSVTSGREVFSVVTWRRLTTVGACVGLVIVGVLTLPLSWRHAWSGRRGLLAAGASAVVAVALSMWAVRGVPIVPTSLEDFKGRDAQLIQAWYDTALATPQASSVEQARAMYETALPRTLEPARRPTFGDGPGQYMIREVGGELEFSWVNWFGQQMVDPARAPMAGRDQKP